jgi:hypothetical protein
MSSIEKLRSLGLSVIPCSGKRPMIEEWQQYNKKLPDEDLVEKWAELDPPNVGLCVGPASGIIAVDVDIDDNKILEMLPKTPLTRMGRPGRLGMFFYKWNGEESKRALAGVDLYYSSGQVILTGMHPDAKVPYRLLISGGMSLEEALEILPSLPASVETRLVQYLGERQRREGSQMLGEGRNNRLTSFIYREACTMMCRDKIPTEEDLALELLAHEAGSWFSDKSEPHGGRDPKGEALKMVRRAIAKSKEVGDFIDPTGFEVALQELEMEGKKVVEVHEILSSADYKRRKAQENIKSNRDAYLRAKAPPLPDGGMIKEIVDLNDSYYSESKPIALAAGLLTMSVMATPRFFSGDVSAAEYYFVIAPSSAGKGYAHDVVANELILECSSINQGIETGRPVSLPAIYQQLQDYRYRTYILKEAEVFLGHATTSSKNGQALSSDIGDAIMRLWDNNWMGKSTFSPNVSKAAMGKGGTGIAKIAYPFVNIFGCTTTHQFKNMASSDALRSGVFGRFLVFPQSYNKRNLEPVDMSKQWELLKQKLRVVAYSNEPIKIQDMDDVLPEVKQQSQIHIPIDIPLWDPILFRKMVDPMVDDIACVGEGDPREPLAGRFAQHVKKLALLYCVSELTDRVECFEDIMERNGFKYRRAKTLRIMPRHVEWARNLFFWMLDEVKEVYEDIDMKQDRLSNVLSNERVDACVEWIRRQGKPVQWRDVARAKHLHIRQQADFIKACAGYDISVAETVSPTSKRKLLWFEYKGE